MLLAGGVHAAPSAATGQGSQLSQHHPLRQVLSARERKALEDDREKLTQYLIPLLPQLLAKVNGGEVQGGDLPEVGPGGSKMPLPASALHLQLGREGAMMKQEPWVWPLPFPGHPRASRAIIWMILL